MTRLLNLYLYKNRSKVTAAIALVVFAISSNTVRAQEGSPHAYTVLRGLAPVSSLNDSDVGRAALAANYVVTGGIQNGTVLLQTPLPFDQQQQQALRDAFITDRNLAQLSDGLGTTLGAAYEARAHYIDREHFTVISKIVNYTIAYAEATTGSDSRYGKYFFANSTIDGTAKTNNSTDDIFKNVEGEPNPFGRAYAYLGGKLNANKYGDPRPFQTELQKIKITGVDYFGVPATSDTYNSGPFMDLTNSPSYPSGHTVYAYTGAVILGVLIPARYPQMMARAAEYGTDRIIIGAHYAMDVIAGRTLALYDMAHLLANDPAYLNHNFQYAGIKIKDFRAAVRNSRADIRDALQAACGKSVEECAIEDHGRFQSVSFNSAFYAETLNYKIPVVHANTEFVHEDVGKIAPEAGNLLTAAYPSLSLADADRILTETEGDGGGFLNDGSAFGLYSRLNMYEAAIRAAALVANHTERSKGR